MDNCFFILVGYDKDENIFFGVSKNGKVILKSIIDYLVWFVVVFEDEWVKVKIKLNIVLIKMFENFLVIVDVNMNL